MILCRLHGLLLCMLLVPMQNLLASPLARELGGAIQRGSGTIALSVRDPRTGALVYQHNGNLPIKPASTLKVITSEAALKTLGPHYKFQTEFLFSGWQGEDLQSLIVRGGADPSFTIESLFLAVRKLHETGVRKIRELYLDDSVIPSPSLRTGQRAYSTGSSGLAFNFNSIRFEVCPTRIGSPARIERYPMEYQTRVHGSIKTVSGARPRFSIDERKESPLEYGASGTIGMQAPCESVLRSVPRPLDYFASVFFSLLRRYDISVPDSYIHGQGPREATVVYTHRSKDLALIIRDLNIYSNNFIAEQILWALGAGSKSGVMRFSRDQGLKVLERFASSASEGSGAKLRIADASGLSHANRTTSNILSAILVRALEDPKIAAEFESSLSVLGGNGTLRKKRLGSPGMLLRGKTGTLNGVRSLAGYVYNQSGAPLAFALIQNGMKSMADAERVEQGVVELLHRTS